MSYNEWSEIGLTEKEYKRQYIWPVRIAALFLIPFIGWLFATAFLSNMTKIKEIEVIIEIPAIETNQAGDCCKG